MLRTNMLAKCEIFDCYIKRYMHLQTYIQVENKEYLSGHRCGKKKYAYQIKIFVNAVKTV